MTHVIPYLFGYTHQSYCLDCHVWYAYVQQTSRYWWLVRRYCMTCESDGGWFHSINPHAETGY